jgi:hypothetical protein
MHVARLTQNPHNPPLLKNPVLPRGASSKEKALLAIHPPSSERGSLAFPRKEGRSLPGVNVDRYLCLRSGLHWEEANEPEGECLHNSTDFVRVTFRENSSFWQAFSQLQGKQ